MKVKLCLEIVFKKSLLLFRIKNIKNMFDNQNRFLFYILKNKK